MKRSGLFFILAVVAITIGNAQQVSDFEISAGTGLVFPSSPMTFANYWEMQYGGGLGVGMRLSESMTLSGSFEYYRFKLDKKGVRDAFNANYVRDIWIFKSVSMKPSAGPSSVTTVSANIRVAPAGVSGWLSPYFVGGVGVMYFSLSKIDMPTTSVLSVGGSDISMTAQQTVTGGTETALFFQYGFGLDIRLMESVVGFIEARYVNGLNKGLGTSYIPVTGGIKLPVSLIL